MGPEAVPEFVAGAMIVVGAWFVLLGKPLAVYFAYYQHRLLKRVHLDVEFNPQVVAAMRAVLFAAGVCLVAMGVFALIVMLRP